MIQLRSLQTTTKIVAACGLAAVAGLLLASPASEALKQSAPAQPSPARRTGLRVGTVNAPLSKAASVGADWMREDLFWPAIEPSRGRRNWSAYDNRFLIAARRGIHLLPLIEGIPTWSSGSTTTWAMPSDPFAYAAFTGQVATRYGPGGTLWRAHPKLSQYAPVYFEIWNEPWYSYFSEPVSPARYARLFKAAASAGRKANPKARFIITADWQYSTDEKSWHNWVDDMYAAVPHLNSYFDAYSTHPYGNGSVDNWTPGNGDAFETRRLEVIHHLFVTHGARKKKMWVTEVGWSTCSSSTSECYSETEQAANYARFDQLARTRWSSFLSAVFYYALTDQGGSDRTNKELWFGVIRANGSHKPAYEELKAALTG